MIQLKKCHVRQGIKSMKSFREWDMLMQPDIAILQSTRDPVRPAAFLFIFLLLFPAEQLKSNWRELLSILKERHFKNKHFSFLYELYSLTNLFNDSNNVINKIMKQLLTNVFFWELKDIIRPIDMQLCKIAISVKKQFGQII